LGADTLGKKAGIDHRFLIPFRSYILKVKKKKKEKQTKKNPKSTEECKARKQQNKTYEQTCTQNVLPAQRVKAEFNTENIFFSLLN